MANPEEFAAVVAERDALKKALGRISAANVTLPMGLHEEMAKALGHEYRCIGEMDVKIGDDNETA